VAVREPSGLRRSAAGPGFTRWVAIVLRKVRGARWPRTLAPSSPIHSRRAKLLFSFSRDSCYGECAMRETEP